MDRYPLHEAAIRGDMAEVKHLVESGADLGHQDQDGQTPLMKAIENGRQLVSQYMVNAMSVQSLVLTDKYGDNVLNIMAVWGRPWLSVWTAICEKCPGLDQQRNAHNNRPIDIVRKNRNSTFDNKELFQVLYTKQYKVSLTEKEIPTYNLTITCVGHEGVGKTCLVTNLKKEKLPIGGPSPTNFGNLYINHLDFDPDTNIRQNLEKGGEADIGRQRLRHVVKECKQRTVTSADDLSRVLEIQEEDTLTPEGNYDRPIYVYNKSNASEQSELKEYELFMDWLEECKQSFDKWFKDTTEANTTDEDKRRMRKFLVQYSLVLGKDIECTHCSSTLSPPFEFWYRCLQCTDTNLCEPCYKGCANLDTDHKDNHCMIRSRGKCDRCECYIIGTKIELFKSYYSTLCLGCHKYICKTSGKNARHGTCLDPSYHPAKSISHDQIEKVAEVISTADSVKTGPRGFISIYDFGGEKVFYNTHHCLLSSDMVFLLVFDVPMCLDPAREKAGFDRIEFWMGSVTTYATEDLSSSAADQVQKRGPPILLIGSHLDQVPGTDEEKLEKFETVINKLKENPKMKPIMERHVHGIYPVSNMNDSTKNRQLYDKMWDKIMEVATLQSQWRKMIPARWLDLELELMTKKAEGCNIMTFEELKELNRTLIVPLKDDADLRQFLQHIQLTGSMLVCNLHGSNPYIVLNFEVITRAFRSIITVPKFKTELDVKGKTHWQKYEKSGKLSVGFLRKLWKLEKIEDLIEKEDLVLFAMETNGLLSKPLADQNEDVDYYIVPSMLQEARPDDICDVLDKPSVVKTSAFCLRFEQEFTPQAVWDKLLASCVHRFKPFELPVRKKSSFIQRGFACLCVDCRWKLAINCKGNELKMVMFTDDKDKTKPSAGVGVNIRVIIEYLLKQILKMNHQNHLKYNYFLHCDYRFTEGDKMVKAEEFLKASNHSCHGPKGECTLRREDYEIWFKGSSEPIFKEEVTDYSLPMDLQHKKPIPKELGRICKYIGVSYQVFFVELNCGMALIEQIMEEYRHLSLRSRMTRLFIRHCNGRPDIDFSHISLAMKKHGIDNTVLLEVVDNRQQEKQIQETPLSEADLCKPPTNRELSIIAEYLNNCYFNFFLELGLEVRHVGSFEMKHKNQPCHVLYEELMRKWITTNKTPPTVNRVLLAMKECYMPWYEVSSALHS